MDHSWKYFKMCVLGYIRNVFHLQDMKQRKASKFCETRIAFAVFQPVIDVGKGLVILLFYRNSRAICFINNVIEIYSSP